MNLFRESESNIPNAETLRLREYAEIISNTSNLIEILENPTIDKGALEYSYSVNVDPSDEYAIPDSISEKVGPIDTIDITLRSVTHIRKPGESEIEYDVEPTHEIFSDAFLTKEDRAAHANAKSEVVKATSISLYLHGPEGTYALSRASNSPQDHSYTDAVLRKKNTRSSDERVTPISQADFTHLLMSIAAPTLQLPEDSTQANLLAPAAFDALNELFKRVTLADADTLVHEFITSDTELGYLHGTPVPTGHPVTGFGINFASNETGDRISVHTNLGTKFALSFSTLFHTQEHIRTETHELGTETVSSSGSYTPTLSELRHLNELLKKEYQALAKKPAKLPAALLSELVVIVDEKNGVNLIDTRDPLGEVDELVTDVQELRGIEVSTFRHDWLDIVGRLTDDTAGEDDA